MVAGLHEQTEALDLLHHELARRQQGVARRGSLAIWFDPETQWLAAPTGDRDGGEPSRSRGAGLASAGFKHALSSPADPDRPHPLSPQLRCAASSDRQQRCESRRRWRVVGQETRAIEITGGRIGDAPMLPDLPDRIPGNQPIGIVTADGAYDTRTCHAAVAARRAAAVIPPRRNSKLRKEHTARATARNEAPRSCRRFGRAIRTRFTALGTPLTQRAG